MTTMTTRKIDAGMLFRSYDIDQRDIDEKTRTVDLAFSSEEPVERWFGQEILDHDNTSVRLDRMKNGGPVLVDHNPRDHVGVVERISIDSDRCGRARVRWCVNKLMFTFIYDQIDKLN